MSELTRAQVERLGEHLRSENLSGVAGQILDHDLLQRTEIATLISDRDSWRRVSEQLEGEKVTLTQQLAAMRGEVEQQSKYLDQIKVKLDGCSSMSKTTIVQGDKVYVQLDANDHVALRGTVISMPCATGDAVVILGVSGSLHYVQQYYVMTREKEIRDGKSPFQVP